MKKTLILVLILILLVTIGFMLFSSLHLGGIEVLGLGELGNKNEKLNGSIQNLTKLSGVVFQQQLSDVSKSAKEYENAKKQYDELVSLSTSNEVVTASQLQKYEIEYLWAKIGKHATDENVVLKIDIAENSKSSGTGYYDLNFTVDGDYVGITDFIYDIENDSSLGFKIEKFKMESSGGDKISATFTCTNIAINIDPSSIARSSNGENNLTDMKDTNTDGGNTNTTNSNTTNASNTNLDSNATKNN